MNASLRADQDSVPEGTIASFDSPSSLKSSPPVAPVTATNWTDLYHPRYLTGKFTAKDHPDFQVVPKAWTDGDGTYYLHARTIEAFGEMRNAALNDGVRLTIVSAFRNFDRQKAIWEAKWEGRRVLEGKINAALAYPDPADRARAILRYSSMPGTSRHHWGTDLDLNRLTNSYYESGQGLKVYEWLNENAAEYGFCQPYTAKGTQRPNGYEEEKWHWSFTPISSMLTAYAEANLRDTMISGFAGAKSAPQIEVVENYVLGINPECRK
ncbi:peptidase M15 [Lewinellaceae bacterium SD302]|nr:peptidase M15 [Lewinellaceae bacterium SD302]